MLDQELTGKLEKLLFVSKVGLLTSVDQEGYPRSRWMTPALVKGRPEYLYAVTATDSAKAAQIKAHPRVEWTFQSKLLDEILSVTGTATVIVDPGLQAEVLEAIGPNLQVFWRMSQDSRKMVVIETRLEEINYFAPLESIKSRSESR